MVFNQITRKGIMTHEVRLSNGETLLVIEGINMISIAAPHQTVKNGSPHWICEISSPGVLVMPQDNTVEWLTDGLPGNNDRLGCDPSETDEQCRLTYR
jgi:hypothetical protein